MFDIGDIIKPKKIIKGLSCSHTYEITHIRRSIDGAYDWDDLTLKGRPGVFCEFDFEKIDMPRENAW